MSNLNYVFDATRENFEQLVMQNSQRGLVLVNYWAPKVGPCLKLWQALEALSKEYQGHFLLVNINTELQKQLVREMGITSVPTVKFYQKGKVVEAIYGAHSKASIQKDINKYVNPLQDENKAKVIEKYQQGDVEGALALVRDICDISPGNTPLHATALKILLREKRYADLEQYVSDLPEFIQQHAEIDFIAVHGKLLQLAQDAPAIDELDKHLQANPKDLDAAMTRAAVAIDAGETEFALEYLLYILGEQGDYHAGLAHKAVLSIFASLGAKHELTKQFQQRLRSVLKH